MNNKPRFVTEAQAAELVELYHLARVALCTKPIEQRTSYYRRLWAAGEFHKKYPTISHTAAYKDLEGALA